jgi:hypothetical protein
MKPCAKKRESIVGLALHALEARQSRDLQEHLATCEGCRRYLAEISNVAERLAAAEANSDVQPSANFHQKLACRLRTAKPDSLGDILGSALVRLGVPPLGVPPHAKASTFNLFTCLGGSEPRKGGTPNVQNPKLRCWQILGMCFQQTYFKWRVVLPVMAALVVMGVVLAHWRPPSPASPSQRAAAPTAPVSSADNDLSPTMANYERVADESLDKLDALLTRQGNRAQPPTPIYTDSTLALAEELH